MNFTIYILLYNSEKSLNWVFDELDKFDPGFIKKVYLVDNKSLDKTIQRCEVLKSKSKLNQKITIMCNNENYGMGGSIKIVLKTFCQRPLMNLCVFSIQMVRAITLKFLIHL